MSRRSFLKGFGLLGVVVASATAPQVMANTTPVVITKSKEDLSHLAPETNTTMTLTADNRTAEEKEQERKKLYGDSPYVFVGTNYTETHRVNMSVGKDNRLWLQVNGEWHRVALET
jgi:hypothetical protein